MFKKLSYLLTAGLAVLAAACSPDLANAQIINPNPPQVAASAVAGVGLSQAGAVLSVVYGTTVGTSMQGNNTAFSKVNTTSSITAATNSAPSGMGALTYSDTNIFGSWQTSANSFAQMILQNSNAGATASTGYVISNDLGTATTFYGEFGINSSGFTGTGALNLPSATYLTGTSGDLAIGTTTANGLHFVVNSATADNLAISPAGVLSGTSLTNYEANINHAQTVLNVAALRALQCVVGSQYLTQGYIAATDGGQGRYVCSTDTSTADNGSTIIAGTTNRFYLVTDTNINARQCGFLPGNADTVNATNFQNCAAANIGKEIYVPAGSYNVAAVQIAKTYRVHIRGDVASYDSTLGTVWNYTGSATAVTIGVNDGNPDSTGYLRDVQIRQINFNTSTGVGGLLIQNSAQTIIDHNSIHGFSGQVLLLHENVITKITNNDIRGSQPASGNYGIFLDTVQYFGNYVVEISGNHIYQINWAVRFAGGRSVTVNQNVFENIRGWTVSNPNFGGLFLFATAGYISDAVFTNNYCENSYGWMFYSDPGSPFTGAILNLVVRQNEYWGSGSSSNVNPGFGNLPRNKVLTQQIDSNFIVDSTYNTNAFLGLTAVFPTTTIFDQSTTIVNSESSADGYEDAIVYSMRPNELLKNLGDFGTLTGGTAGAMTITAGTPAGWTSDISGAALNLIADNIQGTFVVNTPGSGSTFNLFHTSVPCPNVATTQYFVVAFTSKGWTAVKVNGTAIYDSGASNAAYSTQVVTFTVPPSSSSFTLQFATNSPNPFTIAEARVFQIGVAEYTSPGPGATNSVLVKATKRLMKRGAY